MKLIPHFQDIDAKAKALGIPGLLLMESAGRAVADGVLDILSDLGLDEGEAQVALVCGPGNNGGDGFVAARHLAMAGLGEITVIQVAENEVYKEEALSHLQLLEHYPVRRLVVTGDHQALEVKEEGVDLGDLDTPETSLGASSSVMPSNFIAAWNTLYEADLVVDALFGTGLSRPIEGHYRQWVTAMNDLSVPVLAVDMPSGIDAETGVVVGSVGSVQSSDLSSTHSSLHGGVAVRASATLTFGAAKPGLFLSPGKGYAGSVTVADIGIPEFLIDEAESDYRLISAGLIPSVWPTHPENAHKYSVGSVLVVAGSAAMPGAAQLAVQAALASGVGLVVLAAPRSVFQTAAFPPEVVRCPVAESPSGEMTLESAEAILPVFSERRIDAMAIGPGLGSSLGVLSVVEKLLKQAKQLELSTVVDADALNVLAFMAQQGRLPEVKEWLGPHCVLTPHAGEAARLLGQDQSVEAKQSVMNDWAQTARTGRDQYGVVWVQKSSSTVVADLNGWVSINPTGNPGMATAGSGDVLTGFMAGILAQGVVLDDGAQAAVYLHGLTGDVIAAKGGLTAVTASHLAETLPLVLQALMTATTGANDDE